MQLDVRSPDRTTTTTSSAAPIPPSDADLHTRLGSLMTYISALASLMSPEAVVALAYGVPSLDNGELVRFLNERGLAT